MGPRPRSDPKESIPAQGRPRNLRMGARLRHRRGRRVGREDSLPVVRRRLDARDDRDRPHRGALEQDRCEAEIAALKAKKAFLVLKLRGARARGWPPGTGGRRHMRSIELCKNCTCAGGGSRARRRPRERRAAGRHAGLPRRAPGLDHARGMARTRKAPTAPPGRSTRALVKAHPAGIHLPAS